MTTTTTTVDILDEFRKLSNIPRPSYKLDGVRAYLQQYATTNGFQYKRDAYGNCVIIIGTETDTSRPCIIIQSHMDMVCVKSADSDHDFNTDPIKFSFDNDMLSAVNTTLGADNGIGLVSGLVLARELTTSGALSAANLYLLFTADEEEGMEGVAELPDDFLPKVAFVLNVDSEVEHEICAGSVGASESLITSKIHQAEVPDNLGLQRYQLKVTGCRGGHSGCDIHRGQSSAMKIAATICRQIINVADPDIIISSIKAGSAHNAIPESCEIEFYTRAVFIVEFDAICQRVVADVKARYNESNIKCEIVEIAGRETRVNSISPKYIDMLCVLHQGVLSLSPYTLGQVESSTNIGLVDCKDSVLTVNILSRSVTREGLVENYDRLKLIAHLFDAEINDFVSYNGWTPDWNTSRTLAVLKDTHEKLFGSVPKVYTAHAGLEASELVQKYPQWDVMSIGPQINLAHTWRENIILSSIESYYQWLKATVIELAA